MNERSPTQSKFITCGLMAAVLVFGGLPLARLMAADDSNPQARDGNNVESIFGLTKVWSIELEFSAEEFEAMQPAVVEFGFPGGPPPARQEKKEDDKKRDSEKNFFGTDFPWVEATFTANGNTLTKVGVRYSGDITYFVSARGLKRPLKIAFDKFARQNFQGLASVQLHAMPLDPAKARETLAFSVFRAAGVAAPRTAFAEVTLTVPGKHDKAYLGLFTVVENVDSQFLNDRFGSDQGLLMKPTRMRGLDLPGGDWNRYKEQYQPQREATDTEATRVIEFARLINQATDAEFEKQIDSYLDVDAFLRFMAANALTSNLESFLALGSNYALHLDAKTNKFTFIPGDLEFSLANFLLMGSAEQLMDLSLRKPYPGENKLPDRLLAIKDVSSKYEILLKELAQSVLTKARLLNDAEAIRQETKASLEKEAKAVAARREPPPGFGGPGGPAPQPPDLKTFAEKRTASIGSQLSGKSKGYVPQPFNFGPPPASTNIQPMNEAAFRDAVQVPSEFEAVLFAAPPKVSYPVAIAAEPTGEIYVAVDEQGSLGRTPGGGKILRCVDRNGDGKVDDVTVFAKVEHPRGVAYRNGSVWVMHPPTLSVFHDDNADGVADRQDELVTGLTVRNPDVRRAMLATLIRLYHREADYHGTWWGIRPDNTGPYYDRAQWEKSPRIGSVITAAVLDGDPQTGTFLKSELARHQVSLAGVPVGPETVKIEKETPIALPKADANDLDQIGNLSYENAAMRVLAAKGDPRKGEALFKAQSCSACHTTADGQNPKGPHLVDIGKRYKPDELVESILRPSVKLAQGYETYQFVTTEGLVLQGFIVSQRADATVIREANSVQRELKSELIELKQLQKQSAMPDGLTANLTPDQLADLIAFLQSLK